MASAEGEQLAGQPGIGIDDAGRVLGAAALGGDEGPLEVDAGELAGIAQPGQHPGAGPQDVGSRGDAGGDEAGGAVAAVLADRDHGPLRGPGIGEGLPAAAVAVDIDQAGQDVPALGGPHGRADDVVEAGAPGLAGRADPGDAPVGDDDGAVRDDPGGRDEAPAVRRALRAPRPPRARRSVRSGAHGRRLPVPRAPHRMPAVRLTVDLAARRPVTAASTVAPPPGHSRRPGAAPGEDGATPRAPRRCPCRRPPRRRATA